MKNLKIFQKKKLFFLVFFISILLTSNVQASIIATIAKTGLQFAAPEIAQAVNTAICFTNLVACAQAKIIGYVSSKAYEAAYEAVADIAGEETAREIANAISTYNQIKGYLDKGLEIIEELKINEEGEVEKGITSSKEEPIEIGNLIKRDLEKDAVILTNINFNFETKEATFKENGKLKIKIEKYDKQIERVYENIKEEGIIKLAENGDIEEADITTSEKAEFIFGDNPKIYDIPADTRITYKEGIVKVYGKNKIFNLLSHGEQPIKIGEDLVTISKDTLKGKNFWVKDIHILSDLTEKDNGIVTITDKGYFLSKTIAEYKKIRIHAPSILIANLDEDLSDYKNNWIKATSKRLEVQSSKDSRILLKVLPGNELFDTNKIEIENGKRIKRADEDDSLKFRIEKGDYLEVKNRKGIGLIPKIKHKGVKGGETLIVDGISSFILDEEGLKILPITFVEEFDIDIEEFEYIKKELKEDREKIFGTPLEELLGVPKEKIEKIELEELSKMVYRKYAKLFLKKGESVPFQLSSNVMNQELRINSANQFVLLDPEKKEERVVINKLGMLVSDEIIRNELQTFSYMKEKWKDRKIEFLKKWEFMDKFRKEIEEDETLKIFLEYGVMGTKVRPLTFQIVDYWLEQNPDAKLGSFLLAEEGVILVPSPTMDAIVLGGSGIDPHNIQEMFKFRRDREIITPFDILNHEYDHLEDYRVDKEWWETEIKEERKYAKSKINKIIEEGKDIELYISSLEKEIEINEVKNYLKREGSEKFRETYKEEIKDILDRRKKLYEDRYFNEIYDKLKDEERKLLWTQYNEIVEESIIWIKSNEEFKRLVEDTQEIIYPVDLQLRLIPIEVALNLGFNLQLEYDEPADLFFILVDLFEAPKGDDPELLKLYLKFQRIAEEAGLPALHSLNNALLLREEAYPMYLELSPTGKEEDREKRKERAQFGNENQKRVYKDLTQLHLDVDRISPKDYQYIMGIECEDLKTCLKHRCKLYKPKCCEKYITSPHCKNFYQS